MSGDNRRQAVLDAMLEALQHTVGEEHMPLLKQMVEGQVGPVTFPEMADALASVVQT